MSVLLEEIMSVPHEDHTTETCPLKLMLLPTMAQALPTMVTNPISEFVEVAKAYCIPPSNISRVTCDSVCRW
jgi:hypothetical protein